MEPKNTFLSETWKATGSAQPTTDCVYIILCRQLVFNVFFIKHICIYVTDLASLLKPVVISFLVLQAAAVTGFNEGTEST